MKLPRCLLAFCLVLITLLSITSIPVQAQSTLFNVSSMPPRLGAAPTAIVAPSAAAPTRLDLPPLKAVLLVGPIDGDDGNWTRGEKANMELAAAELEAYGVTVHRFYTPDNDWTQITAAARGAHFLLYRGHGVYQGLLPRPTVGGFNLKNGVVSPAQIRADLHLEPNAIVMLYGCFTAGSASNDQEPITSAEAQRRVAEYAQPFIDMGAAGYYANWHGNAFQMFVRALFAGQTLQQTYEAYFDYNQTTVEYYTYPADATRVMWLDKDVDGDMIQYNYAFIGQPEQTLSGLFGSTGDTVAYKVYLPLTLNR